MKKRILVDGIGYGEYYFDNDKDAYALFDLLQKAHHVDSHYIEATDEGNGFQKCYWGETGKSVDPVIRSRTVFSCEEIQALKNAERARKEAASE